MAAPKGDGYGTQEVNQSLLVPSTLDSSFAPFDCRMAPTGPVCTGDRHINLDWAPVDDLGCAVPLFNKYEEDRYSIRYYNHDNLNYLRKVRTTNLDTFAQEPGSPTATITTQGRFTMTYDTPGDDDTITITTSGVLWDIRPVGAGPILRVTGTLVEPHDAPPTLTGHRMVDGVSTRFEDAPLDEVLPEDMFVSALCRAAVR